MVGILIISCDREEKEFIIPKPVAVDASYVGSSGFVASWKPILGGSDYILEVATDELFEEGMVTGFPKVVMDTLFAVSGLEAGYTYYYRVKGSKTGKLTDYSNVIRVTTHELPIPVALDAAEVTPTSFIAQWKSIAEAEAYQLFVASDVNFSKLLTGYNGLEISDTTYAVKGLSIHEQYFYRVKAKRGKSTSNFSLVIFASTSDLVTPVLKEATDIGLTNFTINWQAVNGASGYLLDLAVDPLFSEVLPNYNAVSTANTSVEISGVDADKTYYYRVRATNGVDISENSDIGSAKTLAVEPPGASDATNVQIESFQANWTSVSDAESYLLDVAVDEYFKSMVPGFNERELTGISETITGLEPSTTYYYRIRAKGFNAISSYSEVISVTTAVLPAPVLFSTTETKAFEFTAQWEESSGANSYLLYVATDAEFTEIVSGYNGKEVIGTSYTVLNLNPYETYYYKVKSKRLLKTSDFSNTEIINARIGANCRISMREYTGQYREVYSYDSNNRLNKIELYDINVSQELIREITISYTSGYIDTVYIRQKNGDTMELTEKWVYTFSNNKISSVTKYDPDDESVLEHLKFVFNNGNLLGIDFYSDKAELVLIDKEVYDFNAYGQIISAKDINGVEVKKFIYSSEFNGDFLLNPDLQMLYFDPTHHTNQWFTSWQDFSYYQYFDKNSGEWKSASFMYEYNSKGLPVKLLGSGNVSDLIYEYENCTF